MVWLGGLLRQRRNLISDLDLSDDAIYTLDIYFSYELATKKNFSASGLHETDIYIYNIKRTQNFGNIQNNFNSICSVLDTPNRFTDNLNNLKVDCT